MLLLRMSLLSQGKAVGLADTLFTLTANRAEVSHSRARAASVPESCACTSANRPPDSSAWRAISVSRSPASAANRRDSFRAAFSCCAFRQQQKNRRPHEKSQRVEVCIHIDEN